ncbi:cytidylate kinase [Candidatus Kryptonium thompsonii]|uniref:Cytidylate kinase n=2 Tax=Candidatus Kryptonium thompsonii TaxID=1633631 RepID=A0A0P1LC17_9BACT|nr:(d)CMP kinase [Candidatus Kryptonium thompsoni]CUS78672.1 cytidylate kinase [Candidatus Kryptonium thompsoni]CUS79542.1 cytidylate kinase [Candidatus Kryptonium thompsoni]CUS83842.1 cytidylate kinase [Candidatus Kryptonium thompsoni]CUS84663.1 cytidylate kinase [Candidatus Kryptonium thompsoni]CUS84844.1 cytidylate kinase [Candidatus Kryptonium thompsoni]
MKDNGFEAYKGMRKIIIAIDGPAGSGKSTTARLVAQKLGYTYIDTGAMYRALTLKVIESNVDPNDEDSIVKLAENTRIDLIYENGNLKVILDNRDVSDKIRTPEVTSLVSVVSAHPKVRDIMVKKQRELGKDGGVVIDGRDIGTVVFPNADLKIFMTADVKERAKRRQKELKAQGFEIEIEKLIKEIEERDEFDSNREISPLKKADDAIEIDTTNLTIEEQVELVLKKAYELINQNSN